MKGIDKRKGIIFAIILCAWMSLPLKQIEASMCKNRQDENIMSILWYQQSAKADALYRQGYELAKIRLDQALQQKSSKDKAIILDIDEGIQDVYELLKVCTKVHVLTDDSVYSQAKMEQFERELSLLGYQEVLEKIERKEDGDD